MLLGLSVGLVALSSALTADAAPGSRDPMPPTPPTNLVVSKVSSHGLTLSWSAASDNVGVAGYRVYLNGSRRATVRRTHYRFRSLSCGIRYHLGVAAYDKTRNLSTRAKLSTSTAACSTTARTARGYDARVLADRPVGFWDLGSPGRTEADHSGGGRAGTYEGGTPGSATLPNGERAADFNGRGEYLKIASSSAYSIPTTKKLTWEAWIRPDTLQFPSARGDGYVDFMGKCASYSPTCEWESRMYSSQTPEGRCNRLSAYAFNPSAGLGSSADWQPTCNLLRAGQWLHVVGEYQTRTTPSACNASYPGTIDIWVNGVKWSFSRHAPTGCMSQYRVRPRAASSPLLIGTMAKDYWFKGAIGKVAIYNYLLSRSQISAHYTAMTGKRPSGSCAEICTLG